MTREECEKAVDKISEYMFTENEYTPTMDETIDAVELINKLIDEHFDNKQFKQNNLHNIIKQCDYVNGCRVEKVETLNGEPHYLIAYFDWGANKPQSRWLPEHLVKSYVSAEDFDKVNHRRI